MLKNEDFLKGELWERIISPVRMVHQSGIRLPTLFNPLIEVRRLYKTLEEINPRYPEFDTPGTIRILEKIREVAGVFPSQYVPCHNDLLEDNFVLTEEGERFKSPMCLINWEYGWYGARLNPFHAEARVMPGVAEVRKKRSFHSVKAG